MYCCQTTSNPTAQNMYEVANNQHSPSCYISVTQGSQSSCFLSPVCAICAWFSSTPRLPVAPYKNSYSVTEWRIRLGGNGQSSGTPLKNVCPAPFYFCPFISAPCVETTVQRALGHVSSAARRRLNLVRYCQEFSCSVEKLILYL